MHFQENVSLKKLNTFGIDAKAQLFVEANSETELEKILTSEQAKKIDKKLILGGGSNMLFLNDYDGLVIKINLNGVRMVSSNENSVIVEACSGEVWHQFVLHCIEQNWAGLENLSLIPGCVGAAPIQNIGAYGVEVKDVIAEVHALRMADGQKQVFSNSDCHFGYRNSIFKAALKNQYVITRVLFKLSKQAEVNIQYGAIRQTLDEMHITRPNIKDVSNAVIQIRSEKLPDPKILGNAGSFFKNPELSSSAFETFIQSFPDSPSYPQENGTTKISAAWLIEKAGLKGYRKGNCGVHEKQALVLVNYGNAQGEEIRQLASYIKQVVQQKFGVLLQEEVNYIS